jgi:AraC-like DNA-binding protein
MLERRNSFMKRLLLREAYQESKSYEQLPKSIAINKALLMSIKEYINNHLSNSELSPEVIAKHFRMSLRYLYNLFEEEPVSVAHYIRNARLLAAKNRLQDPLNKSSIIMIALDLGFVNPAHFSKVFRDKFGFSPREAISAINF